MFRKYRDFEPGEMIVVGVDTSMGLGDYVACQFLSKRRLDVPLVYHSKRTMTEFTPILHLALEKVYDETSVRPVVAIERANGGAFEMDRLAALNRLNKYDLFKMPSFGRESPPEAVKLGWDTNTATRPKMLQDLKDAIDKRILTIYDKETVGEMFSFIVCQTSSSIKAMANKGSHDDLIMALAIAYQLSLICDVPMDTGKIFTLPQFVFNRNWGIS